MAHKAIPPLDSFSLVAHDYSRPLANEIGQIGDEAAAFSILGNSSAARASGTSLADLALDLVLNEIVQQARLATAATGATIRLLRGGEADCRAGAGATAAEVAAYLNLRGGIVGACLETGRVQRCDDAEADSRLDAGSCRRLGLRSILMVPVRNLEQETIGVIEVFCARPRGFSDRDVLTLQALSRRVLANIDLVARIMPLGRANPVADLSAENRLRLEAQATDSESSLISQTGAHSVPNWMLLLVCLVTLALLGGWVVRRAGKWRSDLRIAVGQDMSHAQGPAGNFPTTALNAASHAPVIEKATATAPASRSSQLGPKVEATPSNAGPALAKAMLKDNLVVYESGKLATPKQVAPNSVAPQKQPLLSTDSRPAASTAAMSATSDVLDHRLLLPEETADASVLVRVDPEYPKDAIGQHVQGRVLLDLKVSQTGVVQSVHPISGHALLATAASDAVRRWRFRPYIVNGKPTNFETQVALNFALP